ncbi:hypothetical protein NAEGRDRAFT_59370 [Naegleria gruberi]|uniref:Protein kinase domain-containing protein n=1 Tax=Naegleria gruberi TaxID=5762 RepID=D2VVY3_NAEGR|nr:uncharacterized protein NAEGRDRAFT_59370 [Naegleria gruberi]EFC38981.1 hypothetical protein NAEGRDRAFT_59370 [Naegleria gruberi]|eukprot:XP_002671725.1 hypothetical protein NAEGRDRAFT_59370 [Naegleria gruberi strain NEG-M]
MSDQSLMVFKIIHDDSGLLETGETRSEYLQKYKHTNHANVLSMKTFNNYNDDDEASITLREYVIISKFRGNNLRDVRKNLERVSILMVLQIIVQCCGALQSLSLNHIIHRDVKPENIFMSEEGMIVLGDLGCATMAENNLDDMLLLNEENNEQLVDDCTSSCYSSATGFAGTIGFIAPEILNGKCSCKCDIFSLGITILSFLFLDRFHLQLKYQQEELWNDIETLFQNIITNTTTTISEFENDPSSWIVIKDLCKGMTCIHEDNRYSIENIFQVMFDNLNGKVTSLVDCFQNLKHPFKNSKSVVSYVCEKNGLNLQFVSPEDFLIEKELVLGCVKQNGMSLEYALSFRNDFEIVMEAITQNSNAIMYASTKLLNDQQIIYQVALMSEPQDAIKNLSLTSEELKNNREFMLKIMELKGQALCCIPHFNNDKEMVLKAVKNYGNALYYSCENLRNDKDVIIEAMNTDGGSFSYASEELKKDRHIVTEAIKRDGNNLGYACKALRNDLEIVSLAIRKNGNSLKFCGTSFKGNKIIAMEAVKNNPIALQHCTEELRDDRDIVLAAVQLDGIVLEYASDRLRNDKEVVMKAVQNNGSSFRFASEELKQDGDILIFKKPFTYILPFVFSSQPLSIIDNRELALQKVQQNGLNLEYVSEELKNDRQVVLAAISKNGNALKFASEELRNDKQIVTAAVLEIPYTLKFASNELKNNREFTTELEKEMQKLIPKYISLKEESAIDIIL